MLDREFDCNTADIFLSMALKNQSLFKLAAAYVEPEFFENLFPVEEEYYLFWYVLAPAIKKFGKLKLSRDLIIKGSTSRLATLFEDPDERKKKVKKVVILYDKVVGLDIEPDKEFFMSLTRTIMQQGNVLPRLTQIAASADMGGDVEAAVQEVSKLSRGLGPTSRAVVDPFDLLTVPPEQNDEDLVKTHIDWFDMGCGGGLYREEPHTAILPTGQGKTTLACQIAAFRARKGEKTLVVITEGGVNRKMTSKVQGALLQMPCNLFDKDSTNPLNKPEELTDTHRNYLTNARGCSRYVDLVDHGEGISWLDFEREFERAVDEGFTPGLIIIDWAGLLAKSLVDNGIYRDQHMALEHIAIQCAHFCKEHKIPILITQQVAAAVAEQKGVRPSYTAQDVDGCKKWANHFCTAVVSSKFDTSGHGTMFFEKTRYSEQQKLVLQRKGHMSTFVRAKPSVRFSGSRYIDSDESFGGDI